MIKKFPVFLALILLLGISGICKADGGILWSFGKLNVLVPFNEVNAVYLYDFVLKRNMVGAETPLMSAWKLQMTAGGVTSIDGNAAPFLGVNLDLPNPAPNFASLAQIKPGLFGGRDWQSSGWIAGIKASVSIF